MKHHITETHEDNFEIIILYYPHKQRLLFWSDWGTMPKIERSTCAGEGRRILVKKDLIRPLGMVLDHKHSLLYWVDGSKGTVESIDVYGNNRQQRFHVDGARFYGITLYKVLSLHTSFTLGTPLLNIGKVRRG